MDKIICLGKNYLEHATELGDVVPEKPVLFLKPPSVLSEASGNGEHLKFFLPVGYGEVHHECELVVRLKFGGYRLSTTDAARSVDAVTVGLDMTLRTLQADLKKKGHPWTTAKVFPSSAVVGPWKHLTDLDELDGIDFSLKVNGTMRQTGRADQMMLPIADAISYVSRFFPLCEGDLIFTGTPKGVGPVLPGDRAELSFDSISYFVEWQ